MPVATTFINEVGDANSPVQGIQTIVGPGGSKHVEQRPLDYLGPAKAVYGHYRAVSFSGANIGMTAGQIIASLRWTDSTRLFALTRLSMNVEVLSAITAACALDAQAFVFRNSTGNASGTGSTTLTMTGVNQRLYGAMSTSLFATGGEIRTVGTTTNITAAAGKTNDGAPFGAAFWGTLFDSTSTGVAVKVWPGAAITPGGWQDLFVAGQYNHPLLLLANEGIEIQVITANNADGTIKYGFLWEWAELAAF